MTNNGFLRISTETDMYGKRKKKQKHSSMILRTKLELLIHLEDNTQASKVDTQAEDITVRDLTTSRIMLTRIYPAPGISISGRGRIALDCWNNKL
jgi:hypothetical protein